MVTPKNSRRDSLKAWMDAHDLRRSHVAKAAGIPYTTLDSFLKGATNEMLGVTEQKIADAYNLTVEDIFVKGDAAESPGRDHKSGNDGESRFKMRAKGVGVSPKENAHSPQKARMVPVVGYVQAGAFKAVNDFEYIDENTELVPFYDPQYDGVSVLVLIVSGNSCDKIYPDGTKIFVVPAADFGIRLNSLVIVQRFDVTGRAETTMKKVTVVDGAIVLEPQSNDPAHRPILYKQRNEHAQEGIEIKWVVRGAYQPAPNGLGPLLSI